MTETQLQSCDIIIEVHPNPLEPSEPEVYLTFSVLPKLRLRLRMSYRQAREFSFALACVTAAARHRQMAQQAPSRDRTARPPRWWPFRRGAGV